ncbi:MAG: CHRD domain-containing protein [Chloroflexi bacterium]|nr:CHRD domain-containing protein [Chloroflexota bacterium]
MKRLWLIPLLAVIAVMIGISVMFSVTRTGAQSGNFSATFNGFNSVTFDPPNRGAVFSAGTGSFQAKAVDPNIEFTLSYSALEDVIGVHLHFGRGSTYGGILVWLCDDPNDDFFVPTGGMTLPDCPDGSGSLNDMIEPNDIQGIPEQGWASGDMQGLLNAFANDSVYVNLHTKRFPQGEIRGQISD